MTLRVCFLSSIHEPRDKRVFYKEAVSLAQAGFEVVHLAPGDRQHQEADRGVTLHIYRKANGRFARFKNLPVLYRLGRATGAQVFHCNEPDSWLVGVLLRLLHGTRVVFDVHEHYPSRFANRRLPNWLKPLASHAVRALFRALTRVTDRIVLAKRTVAADFPSVEHKVVLVQNFAPSAMPIDSGRHEVGNDRVQAIHLGQMSRIRGWPQLVEAMARCRVHTVDVLLLGKFTDGSEADFAARVESLELQDRIRSVTWVPMEEALRMTSAADIGLILFQPGDQNHVFALPHKLFDYMLAGLPVIAPSFAEEVREIVQEADCGVLVDASDPDAIAAALDRLASDSVLRTQLGAQGKEAVLRSYNWETEAERLVEMYRQLENGLA